MSKKLQIAFVLCVMAADAATAAVSEKYNEWRNGPVQWIMTAQEQRAWRNVKTDAEASAFIDLFWARRDPTPGTFENEYRAEHEGRVILADKMYGEKGRRGAMTDRGRAAIVLGQPSSAAKEHTRANSSRADANSLGGTGRLSGGREEWYYKRDITSKWGVPEATVVFQTHPQTGRVYRDVQRTDFGAAATGAIKASIVNPELTTVPEWAAQGGLTPIAFRIVPQAAQPASSLSPTVSIEQEQPRTSQPDDSQPKTVTATVHFPESSLPTGASRLTLSRDIYNVDLQSKTDPFAKLSSVDVFRANEELGWAAQVCTGSNEEPTVGFTLRLTGTAAGEIVDRAAAPDELVPDRIDALKGCYMLRGAVPLEGMSIGQYQLEVAIKEPVTRIDTILARPFRIE